MVSILFLISFSRTFYILPLIISAKCFSLKKNEVTADQKFKMCSTSTINLESRSLKFLLLVLMREKERLTETERSKLQSRFSCLTLFFSFLMGSEMKCRGFIRFRLTLLVRIYYGQFFSYCIVSESEKSQCPAINDNQL